jgi:hypothetical protein
MASSLAKDATAQPESKKKQQLKRKIADATEELLTIHKRMRILTEELNKEADAEGEAAEKHSQPSEMEKTKFKTLLKELREAKNPDQWGITTEESDERKKKIKKAKEEFIALVKKYRHALSEKKLDLFKKEKDPLFLDCEASQKLMWWCVDAYFRCVADAFAAKFQQAMNKKLEEHGYPTAWYASGRNGHRLTWVYEAFVSAWKEAINELPIQPIEYFRCEVIQPGERKGDLENGGVLMGFDENNSGIDEVLSFHYGYGDVSPIVEALKKCGYYTWTCSDEDVNVVLIVNKK